MTGLTGSRQSKKEASLFCIRDKKTVEALPFQKRRTAISKKIDGLSKEKKKAKEEGIGKCQKFFSEKGKEKIKKSLHKKAG